MAKINRERLKTSFLVAGVVIVLLFAGGVLLISLSHTLVNMYLFFGVLLLLGVLSLGPGCAIWGKLVKNTPRWIIGIIHVLCFTLVVSSVVLGVNYIGADVASLPLAEVVVVDKHSETHYHSRRVGRNRYTRGTPYKVYEVTVELPDGRRKEFTVPLSRYNRLRNGANTMVHSGRGLLGIEIVDW